MCGIIGGFGNQVNHQWVSKQTLNLINRGPDSQIARKYSESLHLGATRLAMTDPDPRSNQPFFSESAVITFNGEIYNFKELRVELTDLGIVFNTESDTEVLLRSLEYWGENAISKIEGMYAFAFFEFATNTLILARDLMGKKPLYYSILNETLHWSSSLSTIRNLTARKDANQQSVCDYLALGYVIDPETISEQCQAVPAGQLMKFELINKKLIVTFPKPLLKKANAERHTSQNIRKILEKAVEERIDGHSSLAISLSGGMDSTIVALLASRQGANVIGYSATWPDSDKSRYNEDSKRARLIAKNLGIEYREVSIFNADQLDNRLKEFVSAMEEPNSNPSGLSMIDLYRAISDDSHRLVLTGDGADEILGGYPRYASLSKIPNILHLNASRISNLLDSQRTKFNSKIIQLLISQSSNKNFDNWLHWHWNFTPKELIRLAPDFSDIDYSKSLRNRLHKIIDDRPKNRIEFNMELDRLVWLNMESNRKLDRISMHYSIEARSPFQDENVIESGLKYMHEHKFRILGKQLLRDEFPELVALGVRDDKAGFISPVGHWLRANPNIVERSISYLSENFPFDNKILDEFKYIPNGGSYRELMQPWSLVVLSYWHLGLSNEK